MAQDSFKPRAYLKVGCPFSFKFLLFVSEARLLDRFEIIKCDPEAENYERIREQLAKGLGGKATFPTVEIAPGRYKSDSDALIEHFAREHGIPERELPALAFYRESIFPQLLQLHEQH